MAFVNRSIEGRRPITEQLVVDRRERCWNANGRECGSGAAEHAVSAMRGVKVASVVTRL